MYRHFSFSTRVDEVPDTSTHQDIRAIRLIIYASEASAAGHPITNSFLSTSTSLQTSRCCRSTREYPMGHGHLSSVIRHLLHNQRTCDAYNKKKTASVIIVAELKRVNVDAPDTFTPGFSWSSSTDRGCDMSIHIGCIR